MQNLIHSIESFDSIGGHSYTTWSGGEGVHEITMNDHERGRGRVSEMSETPKMLPAKSNFLKELPKYL